MLPAASPLARALPWLAGLMMTLPLWFTPLPPLIDLPGHMGRWRIMLAPDAPMLAQSYAFHWELVGNLAADVPMALLGPLLGIELTTWLLVAVSVLFTAAALVMLSRQVHGRVDPGVLIALPLVHAYPFQYGFLNFWLAQGLSLLLLVLWLKADDWPARRRWLLFMPAAALLWVAHAMAWGLFGLIAFFSRLAQRRRAGIGWWPAVQQAVAACLPLLPSALLLLTMPSTAETVTRNWSSIWMKGTWLLSLFRDRWPEFEILCVTLLFVLPFLAFVQGRLRLNSVFLWPGLVVAAVYMALPFWLKGSAYADVRVLPLAAMLLLLSVETGGGARRMLMLTGALFLAVRLGVVTYSFRQYERVWQQELVALGHLPRDRSVLVVVNSDCIFYWHLSRRQHLGAMATVRRDAFTNDQFQLDGAQSLAILRQNVGRYRENPSQIDTPDRCNYRTYAEVDQALPDATRLNFDHVWTIGFGPRRTIPPGLAVLWTNGQSTLYARRPAAR